MDVAKYMTTALLLSSAFGEMNNVWVVTAVVVATAVTLTGGLYLVKNKQNMED